MALQFWQQQSKKSIPIPLANLILWHKGSDKVLNVSNISQWTDLSGLNNHASQSVAVSQPAWMAADINGQPAINPDGSNDYLTYITGLLNGLTNVSFFIVLKPIVSDNRGIFGPVSGNSTGIEITDYNGGQIRINGSNKYYGLFLRFGSYQLIDFTYNSTETTVYKNTVQEDASVAGGAALNYNGVYALGRYDSYHYSADDIAEIIIYSSSLSAPDRAQVQAYLMAKYDFFGITASGYYYAYKPSGAFDPATVEGWIAGTTQGGFVGATTGSIILRYFAAKTLTTYTIKAPASNMNRAPKDFTLQGSNDGVNYTVIDTVTGSTAWGANEVRTFIIDSPGAYLYYKINITANDGNATYIQIKQITVA